MTELVGIPLSALAPSALVGIAVLMVLYGKLIPGRTYDEKVREVADWKREAEAWKAAAAETDKQNQAMLRAFGPTLTDFLQGLRRAGVGTTDDGEDS
jgi:hypothetical protein